MIAPAERKPDLAKYEIKEEIGHGGMAIVYLARDRRLGRDVAVKLIHRHLRENTEVAARFVSEARAVAKLKHPNIVEVYDVSDPEEEERYLICELVRGTTLRKLLTEHRQLPAEIAACVGVEIADALDHAHGMGVIHRDVKPENVLVAQSNLGASSDGTKTSAPDAPLVKITDFGIAKLLDAQGVTSTGQVLGSPAHMAPEQIEGGDVNARSDVFGLGVMLYEAMVGRLPFDGKNPAQVLRRVLDGAFTPPDKARPTVGSRFSAIVSRALAHDPAGRYASAAELSTALRDELAALGFQDVRGELSAYLTAPEAFRESYESRLVDELVRRAAEARKQRDIPLSAACLNRALAFRPDDADLLAEVSSLGRAQRLRRNLVSAAIALGGSALIAAAGFAAVTFSGSIATRAKGAPPAGPVTPSPKQSATAPLALDSVSPAGRIAKLLRPGPKKPKAPLRPTPGEEPPARALVRILVDGPQNAVVRLDGVELPDWFGPPRLITVGQHSFEFDPQSPECCEPGQRLTVVIKTPASEGEVQVVKGRIPYKNAVLELTGAPGSSASCGELGTFQVPSRQSFPMTKPQLPVRCTILPPPGSPVPPKEFDGTLSPGRVFRNPGT